MPEFSAKDVTVVIPTMDRWPTLARTMEGLRHQSVDGFEIVVVVDGDDQPVPDVPGARVLVRPHAGPAAARNAGVAMATGRLVLFLGDDMVPSPVLVERHLTRHNLEPAPHVAVLGHVDWHPEVAGDRILQWLDWSNTQFDYRLIATDNAGRGRFFSSNVSLKRDFFLSAGPFDEDFLEAAYEDVDCGWRLDEHGLCLRYEPSALTHHLHRYDWPRIERRFEGVARGERLMQLKHPEFEPWYSRLMLEAEDKRRVSPLWPLAVNWVPPSIGPLRRLAEDRANTYYYRRLAPLFFNAWEADRGLDELKAYLGDEFDQARLEGHRVLMEREEEAVGDEATFYRSSQAYLYELTAFAMWHTKVPYRRALTRFVPPGSSVLDYGCGIGADGLQLLSKGYRVAFADFDNPSTRYLRWRLEHRGVDAPVYDVEGEVPGGFDAAYSFDVIEHVEDPWDFIGRLEERAAVVAVNFLEPDPDDTDLHKPLPIPALLDHAADLGLLWYRKYYGRSHLVIYRSPGAGEAGLKARIRSRGQRLVGERVRQITPAHFDRLDRLAASLRRKSNRSD
jgi:GT2 family glycosyltransferase